MTMFNRLPDSEALSADLHRLVQWDAQVEQFRLTLRSQIKRQAEAQGVAHQTMSARPEPTHRSTRPGARAWRVRMISAGTAAILVLGGVVGYSHFQAPASVSAAQIAGRTVSALTNAASGNVIHEAGTIHVSATDGLRIHVDGLGLTEPNGQIVRNARVDQWTQISADGGIERQDVTVTDIPSGTLLSHQVITANDTFWYDAGTNGTTVTPGGAAAWRHVLASDQPVSILNLESGGQSGLLQLLNEARQGGAARYLGQQHTGATTLEAIQITHPLYVYASPGSVTGPLPNRVSFTVYVNAQNYLIDHVIAQATGPDGQVVTTTTLQITQHAALPATSAPAGTFSFSSPPGACILTVNPAESSQSRVSGPPCFGATRP